MEYLKFTFSMEFEKPVYFKYFPVFSFRSVLGKQLRALSCLFPGRNCSSCSINNTCSYAQVFESHINKNNPAVQGRNRASHPFVLSVENYSPFANRKIDLSVTVFGTRASEIMPLIYTALGNAGKEGLLKERTKFKVVKIRTDWQQIGIENFQKLNFSEFIRKVDLEDNSLFNYLDGKQLTLNIDFITPLRLKVNGKFLSNPDLNALGNAFIRRLNILERLYGNSEPAELQFIIENKQITEQNFDWKDYEYFSSRQRRKIRMGGVTGNTVIKGIFTAGELAVLKACELFHIGKNTSFGLGRIKISFEEARGQNGILYKPL